MPQKRVIKGKIKFIARYRTPDGREHSKSFDRQKAAKDFEAEQRRAIRLGTWLDPETEKVTVGEVYDMWAARPVRKSTADHYADTRAHFTPILNYPIRQLKKKDVDALYRQLIGGRSWAGGRPLAESTARIAISNLRSAVMMAVDQELVHRCVVTVPKPKTKAHAIDRAEVPAGSDIAAMADLLETGGHECTQRIKGKKKISRRRPAPDLAEMVRICMDTGMRVSEMCALQVQDVDFLEMAVHVQRQMCRRVGETGPLKTTSSYRAIPVPAPTIERIAIQSADKTAEDWLFTKPNGRPYTATEVSGFIISAATHLGLTMSFHSIRHYYATRLISAKVPVNAVQAALGHATASTTLNVYTHFWPGADTMIREALQAADTPRGIHAGSPTPPDTHHRANTEVTAA